MANVNKIVAVILNYKSWQETIDCVSKLLSMNYANHEAVVVENGSENESAERLRNAFDGEQRVHLIISDENIGFARGNNLGIRKAINELNADFVYVANSDTLNTSGELYNQIIAEYESGVGVLSPTVQKLDGSYHLPAINADDVIAEMNRAYINALYSYYFFRRATRRQGEVVQVKEKFEDTQKSLIQHNYILHGCAYFLTPDFFNYFDGLFPGTFLYWEELDLLLLMQKAHLRTKLVKTDIVIHKVNASTNTFFKEKEKKRFKMSLESGKKSMPLRKKTLEQLRKIVTG